MRKLAAPLLLFFLCVGFYWKLTLTGQYTFLDSPDMANLDLPRLQFQATAWRHSQLPLWDPYQWAGQPFLGPVTGAAYPANWLLAASSFREGKLSITVVHWYLVLIHFQAAFFCYLLCRDWKRSQAASVLGGLVFSLGGFMGTTEWPQILNGALWLPLVVLFLVRALRGRRALFSAAMSGALLGLSWLSGHHEVPIYATTAIAGLWVIAFVRGPGRFRILQLSLAAGLATVLIAAVQIIPAAEYAPLAKRWVGLEQPISWKDQIPYAVHQQYSWHPSGIPGIVTPRPAIHVNPFIGIAAFALALLGAFHGGRRLPQVRLLLFLAAAGLFLAMASSGFVHGVLYAALPVFEKARVPARALALFGFAAGPLTAYGFDALQRRSSPWLARIIVAIGAISGLLFAAAATGLRLPQANDPAMLTALVAILSVALFSAWRARAVSPRLLACAIALLILTELSNVAGVDFASRVTSPRPGHLERLFHHNDIASFLRAQPQPVRVETSEADIPYNFGDWHGIPALDGFTPSATTNLLELERHKPRVQDLLGINYYIGRAPPRPGLELLTVSASGLNVYRNPAALPRVWIVHQVSRVANYEGIRARLDPPDFQPRQEALLLTPPPAIESCPGTPEEANYRPSATPNRVRIDVEMACRGIVILSDTYFPGWRATVDGHPAAILAPYGALRGVVVEKGAHQIEFVYLPASAITGGALTLVGIAFVLWTRFRTRKVASP